MFARRRIGADLCGRHEQRADLPQQLAALFAAAFVRQLDEL
jgi:hypothetical protein